MKIQEKRLLNIGDEVYWVDPDDSLCSGVYKVQEIRTSTGRVIDEDSVLVLTSSRGSVTDVYASELS
jgi:hypothetical protein